MQAWGCPSVVLLAQRDRCPDGMPWSLADYVMTSQACQPSGPFCHVLPRQTQSQNPEEFPEGPIMMLFIPSTPQKSPLCFLTLHPSIGNSHSPSLWHMVLSSVSLSPQLPTVFPPHFQTVSAWSFRAQIQSHCIWQIQLPRMTCLPLCDFSSLT